MNQAIQVRIGIGGKDGGELALGIERQGQATGIHAVEMRREDDGGRIALQLMRGPDQLDTAAHQLLGAEPQPASVEKSLAKDLKRLFRPGFALRLRHIGKAQLEVAQRDAPALARHHKQHTPHKLAQATQHGQRQLGQHMHAADGDLAGAHAFSPRVACLHAAACSGHSPTDIAAETGGWWFPWRD
jgi:hypothetical protein